MRRICYPIALVLATVFVLQAGCAPNARDAVGDSERMNTGELMKAAVDAQVSGRVEDAGFLLFAGLTRAAIDREVYPPADEHGGSSGMMNAGVLGSIAAEAVEKPLDSNPLAFANAIK